MEATKTPKTKKTATAPSREAIEYRAYELYLSRNGAGGNALEDWLNAERELSSVKQTRKSKAA